MKSLKGIGTAPGFAVAKALKIDFVERFADDERITFDDKDKEKEHFTNAVDVLNQSLERKRKRLLDAGDQKEAEYVLIQQSILLDDVLVESILELIEFEYSAISAIRRAVDQQIAFIKTIQNSLVLSRVSDIEELAQRLMYTLSGLRYPDISHMDSEVILVAKNIPGMLLNTMKSEHIKGVILEENSSTGHAALLTIDMEIPSVTACAGAYETIETGKCIYIDGISGEVAYDLCAEDVAQALKKSLAFIAERAELKKYASLPAKTKDGVKLALMGNVIDLNTATRYQKVGADGVGLYRTDTIYAMRDDLPLEEEQFERYRTMAEKLEDKPFIIRTLDGDDHNIKSMDLPQNECNPFLGYRAIRLSLEHRDIFITQLKAILRASAYGKGNVCILVPFITDLQEVKEAKSLLEQAKDELAAQQILFDKNIPFGIVIEVPAAAVMAESLIEAVDFFAVSINNFSQYMLAADRLNPVVAGKLNCLEPAVLRMLKVVLDACAKANKKCYIYGEMAAEPRNIALFLGLGAKSFSVNPSSIPYMKRFIEKINYKEAQEMAQKAIAAKSLEEIIEIVESLPQGKTQAGTTQSV